MEKEQIVQVIWKRLGFCFSGDVSILQSGGVLAAYDGIKAQIGGNNRVQTARAAMLFAKNIKEGKTFFRVEETAQFDTCGCMLDMSRNAVMRPEAVKEYTQYLAAFGFSRLLLYTEDTYELKRYPKFGYRRGRYTKEELKDIVDYAQELGVEAVPCIQTLGHMEQYLKWPQAQEIKDTQSVLLCGEEQTYQLIEEMVKTLREVYHTDKIHIGMDEAHDVGLGNYLKKHGYTERFSLLMKHLERVCAICRRYGFQPMMWSDMFFRLGSADGSYYDLNCTFTQEQKKLIPDVDLIYWDYYHTEETLYQKMIKNHLSMEKKIVFAGGLWTWHGMLVHPELTYRTMIPAMKRCVKDGIKDVFITMWGDDGAEVDYFSAVPLLAVFSEYCYQGAECTIEQIQSTGAFVGGVDLQVYNQLSLFHEPVRPEDGSVNPQMMGKRIFYSDLFYDTAGCSIQALNLYQKRYEQGVRALETVQKENEEYSYAYALFRANALKCKILKELRPAYQNGDREKLLKIREDIMTLNEISQKVGVLHEKKWRKHCKMFGWEVLQARYAMLADRYQYVCGRILAYTEQRCDRIEEMDFEVIEEINYPSNAYRDMYR